MKKEQRALTEEEILSVIGDCSDLSDTHFIDLIIESRNARTYLDALKDHRVLEIGPGIKPINSIFPCREYISATRKKGEDGLSLLKRMEDRSAVVVSFGVIDDTILKRKMYKHSHLKERYLEELIVQIKRVGFPFSIHIGLKVREYLGEPSIPAYNSPGNLGGIYLGN